MQLPHPINPVSGESYVAHEVNQPLTAILVNAETALGWLNQDRPNLEAVRRAIERVMGNAERAADIVRSARKLIRVSKPTLSQIDVHSVVERVLDLSAPVLSRRGVTVETVLGARRVPVLGDRAQLEQVVSNLVVNAAEAMADVPRSCRLLKIGVRRPKGAHLVVDVKDTGTGIDPAIADRIFDPLFTTKEEGTGLGLSICRSIVDAHGGRLWATRNPPRGSTFSFTLPAVRRLSA